MQNVQGKWAARFIWASIIQGLLAVVVTLLIIDPTTLFTGKGLYYSASRVIASNGGGTWLFTGYIAYLVVGVVAMAVTAIFYFYLEGILGKVYKGLSSYLAWGHLIFMNVGVVGAMFLMMWGGYMAGWGAASANSGGGGLTSLQIHEQILGWLPVPIGAFIVMAALGAVLGGLGFVVRSRTK